MDVPMVLQQTSQGSYKVAGDAYVHEVMDGELMLSEASEHPRWQSVHLQ